VPDPIVDRADGTSPEHEALIADSVGLALLVVLDTLSPPERIAFVLHDLFGLPFGEIAPVVGRSPEATRQLASRARRRVRGEQTVPDADLRTQREVVGAFLAAARKGDFDALLEILDPDVVLRVDLGPKDRREVRGAAAVAGRATEYAQLGLAGKLVLVNGAVGLLARLDGELYSLGGFTIRDRRIVAMDILGDRRRLRELDLEVLDGPHA
jgi:RNA polymerase sigma-70 factor (ECF subfamily)